MELNVVSSRIFEVAEYLTNIGIKELYTDDNYKDCTHLVVKDKETFWFTNREGVNELKLTPSQLTTINFKQIQGWKEKN